jgi:hypothetical protein
MPQTHRLFHIWLLYLCCVVFGIVFLWIMGLPQIALAYDHSYLTALLFALYAIAEAICGRQAWRTSKEIRIADDAIAWLSAHYYRDVILVLGAQTRITLIADDRASLTIPPSDLVDHLALLLDQRSDLPQVVNQQTLLEITSERIYERSMMADFISSRIVWLGIFATIFGVIMAFWPMIGGASLDTMKANLGGFFGGIAVAFIPTAVSFLGKIILDCSNRIIEVGARQLIEKITVVAEMRIIPFIASPTHSISIQRQA